MTDRLQDRQYKAWLEDQADDDPTITFVCRHCGEDIELGDGGFMSWTYQEISDHMEICEELLEYSQEIFFSKPKGFGTNGRNYGVSK